MTIVFFNPSWYPIKSPLLGTKCEFKHKYLLKVGLKLNKLRIKNKSNFHPLGIVGRGKCDEDFNSIAKHLTGFLSLICNY